MKVLTCLRTLIVLLCIGYYSVFAAEAPRRASNAPNQRNNGPSSSGFSKDSRVPSTESNNGGSRPNTYLSRNPERAALNNNKNKFDFDGKPNGSEEAKNWKSGQIFNQKRKSQRNDPWWMRDEEKNNPRIKAGYCPWWAVGPPADMSGWKVNDLRVEAEKRGMSHDGLKKAELVEQLAKLNALYSLTDDNFKYPLYVESILATSPPSCYPLSYEGGEAQVAELRKKISLVPPTPASK